jgi:hypothetical protein
MYNMLAQVTILPCESFTGPYDGRVTGLDPDGTNPSGKVINELNSYNF